MIRRLIVVLLVLLAVGAHVTAAKRARCPDRTGTCFLCLRYCAHCVELYGRDVYNGPLCADDCVRTDGGSKDEDCANQKYLKV